MIIIKKLSENTKNYIEKYFDDLDEMSKQIKEMPNTNSISQIFIHEMIPHHEMAIKMSQNILCYTTDTDIETLAKDIISTQQNCIKKMEEMYENCMECENSERDVNLYKREFLQIFDTMTRKMASALSGNNLNTDFLSEMIPHHEGAIFMSKNVLQFSICDLLKELAEGIINAQTSQLEVMKNLLKKY